MFFQGLLSQVAGFLQIGEFGEAVKSAGFHQISELRISSEILLPVVLPQFYLNLAAFHSFHSRW